MTADDSSYLLSGRLARSDQTREDCESFYRDHFESFDFESFDLESFDFEGLDIIKREQARLGKICISLNDWQTN